MKNRIFIMAIALAATPVRLLALDASINLGVGVEHTDNALQSEANQQSELEKRATAGLQLDHQGSSVVASVSYNVEYTDYDKDTQDGETSVTGDTSIVYEQIEQQLFWTIENSRRNIIRDKQLLDVQENREDRSISSISPRLILRASPVDAISASVSYTNIAYEDSGQQDSERMGAALNWAHSLSKIDRIIAGLTYQDVTFDLASEDYEYYRATVAYEAELSRLAYQVTVGYNQSKRETDDAGGGYFNASATYDRAPSTWQIDVLHELTDTSQQNNNDDITGLSESSNIATDIDVFERSSFQLMYSNEGVCGACVFNASLLYESENYETLDNDGDEVGLNVGLNYRYSRLVSMGGDIQFSDFSFTDTNTRSDYDLISYAFNVRRDITRDLAMILQVSYSERSSGDGLSDYEELRGGIRVTYQF